MPLDRGAKTIDVLHVTLDNPFFALRAIAFGNPRYGRYFMAPRLSLANKTRPSIAAGPYDCNLHNDTLSEG